MQAIITKILPATATKPTRIKAICASVNLTLSKGKAELEVAPNFVTSYTRETETHRVVALHLLNKLDWYPKSIHTGDLPNGDYVHVLEY